MKKIVEFFRIITSGILYHVLYPIKMYRFKKHSKQITEVRHRLKVGMKVAILAGMVYEVYVEGKIGEIYHPNSSVGGFYVFHNNPICNGSCNVVHPLELGFRYSWGISMTSGSKILILSEGKQKPLKWNKLYGLNGV